MAARTPIWFDTSTNIGSNRIFGTTDTLTIDTVATDPVNFKLGGVSLFLIDSATGYVKTRFGFHVAVDGTGNVGEQFTFRPAVVNAATTVAAGAVFGVGAGSRLELNTLTLGHGNVNKYIDADQGLAANPSIRYNAVAARWQFTDDGTTWATIASAGTTWDGIYSTDKTLTLDDTGLVWTQTGANKGTALTIARTLVAGDTNGPLVHFTGSGDFAPLLVTNSSTAYSIDVTPSPTEVNALGVVVRRTGHTAANPAVEVYDDSLASSVWRVTYAGNQLWGSDGLASIGAAIDNRPDYAYIKTGVAVGAVVGAGNDGSRLALNSLTLGHAAVDKYIYADQGGANDPGVRYNNATTVWELSNDGVAWNSINPLVTDGNITLTGGGSIVSTAVGNITVQPDAGGNVFLVASNPGFVNVGTGTPTEATQSYSLYVQGDFEIGKTTYFRGQHNYFRGFDTNITNSLGDIYLSIEPCADAGINFLIGNGNNKANRVFVFADYANTGGNGYSSHNTLHTNPTVYWHSATVAPAGDTQWISRYHDQTNGVDSTGTGGHLLAPYNGAVYFEQQSTASTNFCIKTFHQTITLALAAETDVGLTPNGIILGAAIRVSTQITGLDSADHHIKLGIVGTTNKYCDASQGGAATTIDVNKKAKYTSLAVVAETSALKLTVDGGGDNIPASGAVEVEVHYLLQVDIPNP